ncbi:MAG: type II toxin-antitoxin system VapC family toxin [Chromatiales bacterium]|jgi:tRNA(fMet)-specific endonuclease VapC|nr:type II toxin-antitoxin system VapC family toxin [Chromatiales bacterium]
MPHRYLLDTNIVSALIRDPQGAAAARIAAVGEDTICTSIVVAAELRFGAVKSGSRALKQRVDVILSALEVVPLEPPADEHYGEIRQHLARQGTPIGANDLLIAAHARSLDLALVTANVREFARVPGLRVEDWLAA